MRILGQKWVAMVAVAVAVWAGMAGGAFGQVKALKAVAVKGVRYVALKDLAAMYKLKMGGQGAKGIVISGEYVKLEFQGDGRQATINGTSVWLHQSVAKVKGNWCICDADAQFTVDPLVRPSAYLGGRGTATVALDAGHGGKDPGALAANGTQEKMLSLDIARRVRSHLAVAGVKVVMTRDSDVFLELADRPKAASKAKADLFVSVHLNATAGTGVKGVETFAVAAAGHPPTAGGTAKSYPAVPNNAFNHSGTVLAYQIQKAVSGITRAEDRGVKRARFAVLRESVMPAALVECGFLTNPQEAARLQTPSYRETVAQGIAQGILNYLQLVKRAKLGPGAAVAQAPAAGAGGGGVKTAAVLPSVVPAVAPSAPAAGPGPAVAARGPVAVGAPGAAVQAPVAQPQASVVPPQPQTQAVAVAARADATSCVPPGGARPVGSQATAGPAGGGYHAPVPGTAGRGMAPPAGAGAPARPPVAVAPPPGMVLRTAYRSAPPQQ